MFEVGVVVWGMGVLGIFLCSGYLIEILLVVEVSLGGVILSFIGLSLEFDDVSGLVMALMILVVAAVESCVGLGVLIAYYDLAGSESTKGLSLIRG